MDSLTHNRETEPLRSWENGMNLAVFIGVLTHSEGRSAPCAFKKSPHDESKDIPRPNRESSFACTC